MALGTVEPSVARWIRTEVMVDETEPNPAAAALLTIDVQRDFCVPGGPAEVPGTVEAIPAMRQVVDRFRCHRRPIIHVVRLYRPDGSNVDLSRRALVTEGQQLVAPGTEGAELVEGLKPDPTVALDTEWLLSGRLQQVGDSEWIMYKPRWGAFFQTPLAEHLHRLGVDSVVVCGCNFPNCPRTTVYEASERDFRLVLVRDATSGLYERGEDELASIGVRLFTAQDCEAWVADRRAHSPQ